MKTKDQFTARPKPPDRKQIEADLTSAAHTDVVFTKNLIDHPEDISNLPNTSDNMEENAESSQDRERVNATYSKVTTLIELHDKIIKEPESLDKQYSHLEKLGEGVADSIDQLKTAAKAIGETCVK